MSRSLRVAPDYIQRVKLAIKRSGFPSQQSLADEIGMARATISNFLNGKSVDFSCFVEISDRLGLDWQAIAYLEAPATETDLLFNRDRKPSASKEVFKEAVNSWDLEKLYADLGYAKRVWAVYKQSRLTEVEKQYLRGLLCGYSPDEIAAKLHKEVGSVRVQLSKGLYRYVEELLERPPNSLENWRDIGMWLAEAGYRLDTQLEQKEQNASVDIDALVQEVREKIKPFILSKCGAMKVLNMSRPFNLANIYTNVNLLQKISGRRMIEIDELQQGFNPDSRNLSRIPTGISEQLILGIKTAENYEKVMVWGKPGAGKTTFLKHLAIQCIEKKFQSNLVPIFINISEFATTKQQIDLLEFINQIFAKHEINNKQMTQLLNHGKFLFLFDGFDEIKAEKDSNRVLKDIRNLLLHFYQNRFILACRLAATEYRFPEFIEVEIADFDDKQITHFANKWFSARCKDTKTSDKFLKQLKSDKPIKELAANPLLLTMLCLVFEENAEFPKKRFDLFKEAIDIWLIKWDASRGIERHQIYPKLELRSKRDLLSYIAYKAFERGDYFFKKEELEEYIIDFIRALPNAQSDPKALQVDSEKVLESIETQHGLLAQRAEGIYSFSHITFQEYFAARQIITTSNPRALDDALQNLVSNITDRRWREVFFLTVGAQNPADYLLQLMKEQIDELMAADKKLQEFLIWVNEQSLSVKVLYKRTGVRAFYLDINIDIDPDRTLGCAIDLNCTFVLAYASFLARVFSSDLTSMLDYTHNLDLSRVPNYADEPAFAIALSRSYAIDKLIEIGSALKPEMRQKLQELKEQLPDINGEMENQLNWWKTHSKAWDDQVKELIVKPHKFGNHYSQFSEEQQKLLKQYYEANLLLVECMKIANMSPEARLRIMETLLLPIAEIEQQQM